MIQPYNKKLIDELILKTGPYDRFYLKEDVEGGLCSTNSITTESSECTGESEDTRIRTDL